MVLQRWYPIGGLRRMEESVNRQWRGFGGRNGEDGVAEKWLVPLDVVQGDDSIVVRASLAGVPPEDIEVTIEDGVLTIKGQSTEEQERKDGSYLIRERRGGTFHRSLRLPDTVDTGKADSSYKNGVLSISFPKLEAKKARRLAVNVKS